MWYPVAGSKTNMATVVSQCGSLKRTGRKLSKLDPCPRSSRANSTASASALLAPISPCAFGDSAQYLCNHPSWAHTSTHTAHNNHATTLLGTHAHTHSEPTSCSAGRPSRRSSCTYLSPSLSVHECFQLRLQHHHSALRFEFHVQVLHPMLDYRQTFNCAPAWPSGPSSPFRPRRCRVASPAPYGRHPSPMSPSPMAESKTTIALTGHGFLECNKCAIDILRSDHAIASRSTTHLVVYAERKQGVVGRPSARARSGAHLPRGRPGGLSSLLVFQFRRRMLQTFGPFVSPHNTRYWDYSSVLELHVEGSVRCG